MHASPLKTTAYAQNSGLGAVYRQAYENHYYPEFFTDQLPNLIFNLGVWIESKKVTHNIVKAFDEHSLPVFRFVANQAVSFTVNAIAAAVAGLIGMDPDAFKHGAHELKKPINDYLGAGRDERASRIWNWIKQMASRLHFVAKPVLRAAGAVQASKLESSAEYAKLAEEIRKHAWVKADRVEVIRSMNPKNVGFKAITNTFFNVISPFAYLFGSIHGKLKVQLSKGDSVLEFERAVNKALGDNQQIQVNFKEIAEYLELDDLTSNRFYSRMSMPIGVMMMTPASVIKNLVEKAKRAFENVFSFS